MLYLLLFPLCVAAQEATPPPGREVMELISRAGNAGDDAVRLKLLQELQERNDLSPQLRDEANKITNLVQIWVDADSRNKRLPHFIDALGGMGLNYWKDKDKTVGPKSLFWPVELMYRARLEIWCLIETALHTRQGTKKVLDWKGTKSWLDRSWGFMAAAHKAFPDNPIVKMYLGTPTPWVRTYPDDADAPEWANLQRRSIEGLTDIIHWWIDHRQRPDGEYGGGLGDDVEMWRWWVPVLIGFHDPKIEAAQEKLSRRSLEVLDKAGGYVRMNDVEHSSEDFTDAVTPMLHLRPDDPAWVERALTVEKFMRRKWLGQNERGFWQIKHIFMGSQGTRQDPVGACETPYHSRITQPLMVAWLRTGHEQVEALAKDWLPVWIDAARREEAGKPAGIVPAGIRWPSGRVSEEGEDWQRPHEDPLYDFPNAMALLTDSLLAAWHQTGDEAFLEPIRSMARICLSRKDAPYVSLLLRSGSHQHGPFVTTVEKYTLLTGDRTFEPLIEDPYVAFRLTGDRQGMLEALRKSAKALSRNWECYTSEVRWTDRVISFPGRWYSRWYGTQDRVPELKDEPDPELIFNTSTGNAGLALVFPSNAVRWVTEPREIAALVTKAEKKSFDAELYHFGGKPRAMEAELLLLEKGPYEAVLRAGNEELSRQTFTVGGPRTPVKLTLPSRRPVLLDIKAK